MNDTKKLINKVKAISNQVDRMNNTLRLQELRRIMNSGPSAKAPTQKVDIIDALSAIQTAYTKAGRNIPSFSDSMKLIALADS